MSIRDTLLAAYSAGNLLDAVAALASQDHKSIRDEVSSLHNAGEIDFVGGCLSDELDRLSQDSYFPLQRVFCDSLPKIECPVMDAATASIRLFEKGGTDGTVGLVFRALCKWFEQTLSRAEEGLTLLRFDNDRWSSLVRPVLLAGAAHDAGRFTVEALALSRQTHSTIPLDALSVLGAIVPGDDDVLLQQVINRFNEVIDATDSDHDAASTVRSALHLLERIGDSVATDVERLLVRVCKKPTPSVCRVIADDLYMRRKFFTDEMIDASLQALQNTNKEDVVAIKSIDLMLYQWNVDRDRERVLRFLQNLLSNRDDPVDIDQLRNFRHRLTNGSGELLGWYVVSLLLTGDHRLSIVADKLLPYPETRDGLDIDLAPFELGPRWIPFLARKILGYCLLKRESASALLLSCLRCVAIEERPALEELVVDQFLMNYLQAMEWFEAALSSNDPAEESVERLSASINQYVDDLTAMGVCPAFAPSDRQRQLQRYRQADFWRKVQDISEEGSLLSLVGRKATVLYGSGSIVYVYDKDGKGPHRKEMQFVEHKYTAEIPRLDAIDPVSLRYVTHRFQTEPPPS